MKQLGYFVFAIYILCTIWLVVTALVQLHLYWYAARKKKKSGTYFNDYPFISVQVPVYNEKHVIEGLLHSLSNLDYPKDKFEILVLDDSTDETSAIIDSAIDELREKGLSVQVIRRADRSEFKAGALENGLKYCMGSLISIFDADFRPSPDFFKALVPHFDEPSVGLVQARWTHENMQQNFLTRIQSYLLDVHFKVEQAGRHNAGYFLNFCGTAGIWRKECIIDAGGWDGKVLSEDLDLSYRAQLKGWKLIFDEAVEVPAQLPAVINAFKIQQFRWTKGIAQTARKTLLSVCKLKMPFAKKLHSVFHLLSSLTFVCLFINALLTVPLLHLRNLYPEFIYLSYYTIAGVLNLAILTFIYYKSSAGKQSAKDFLLHYPVFIVVYLALSVQNAFAVTQGFIGVRSAFVRTPKFSNISNMYAYLKQSFDWTTLLELLLMCYFMYGVFLSFYYNDFFLLFFFIMIISGLCILIHQAWKTWTKLKFY